MFHCFFQVLILKPFQNLLEIFFPCNERSVHRIPNNRRIKSKQIAGVYCIEIIQQDFILQLYKSHNIEEKTYIIC